MSRSRVWPWRRRSGTERPPLPDVRYRRTLGFIAAMVRTYPRQTLLLVVLLVISGVVESVGIFALLPLLELATGTAAQERAAVSRYVEAVLLHVGIPLRLDAMLILISAAMLVKGAFRLLAMRQVGYTVSRVATDLRFDYIDSLLSARWSHLVQQPAGRLASAMGHDAMRASAAYRQVCALFAVLVQIVIYATVAVLISWQIALMALAAGATMVAIRSPLVGRARGASQDQNQLVRSISIRLTDALAGIKPIKAMGGEQYLRPLLNAEVDGLNRAQQRQVLAWEGVVASHEPLLVVLLSIMLYTTVVLTAQPFASVLVVAVIFTRLVGQIGQAQTHYQEVTFGEAAFWAVRESTAIAAAQRESVTGRLPAPDLDSALFLDGVTFGYGDAHVLDRVSLEIPAGRFVTLVGPSGSGKTTIADLIVGLYSPSSGRITVDGVPLDSIDLGSWRRRVGYVPQDAFLFHDTLFHNVSMGDPAISRDQVRAALEQAGAAEFVASLPAGLDTLLAERGARLSGGQRQRVAIARALVRRPRLLILDEVTTSLDPVTEAAICETLRGLGGSVTILAISHQAALVDVADIVYNVEKGSAERLDLALGHQA
jgi:ATP-binding cassette, subfamily C, bacterial